MGFLDRFRPAPPPPDDFTERMFLIPTDEPASELQLGWRVADGEESFPVRAVKDELGRVVLPAFTSEERLVSWMTEGSSYMALYGSDLLETLITNEFDRIVVDTRNPEAFAIEREEARAMLGRVRAEIPAGTRIAIGEIDVPEGFLDDVRRACASEPAVIEAFVYGQAVLQGDEEPRPNVAVGLHLDSELAADAGAIFDRIGPALEPESWGLPFIDFHNLEGDKLEWVRETTSPVFTRQR